MIYYFFHVIFFPQLKKIEKKMKEVTCQKLKTLLNELQNGKELSTEQHLRLQNILINYTTPWISILNEDIKIKIVYSILDIDPENTGAHFLSIWKHRTTIMSLFESKYEYNECLDKLMKQANVVKHKSLFKRAFDVQHQLKNFSINSTISEKIHKRIDMMVVGKTDMEASCTNNEKLGNFIVFWSSFINSGNIPFENCLRIARAGSRMSIQFHEAKLIRDCGGKNAVSPFRKFDTLGIDNINIWFINTDPCYAFNVNQKRRASTTHGCRG